jgi:hypothetical protein
VDHLGEPGRRLRAVRLGLAATKAGDLASAVEHLRSPPRCGPDIAYYGTALRGARAALTAAQR